MILFPQTEAKEEGRENAPIVDRGRGCGLNGEEDEDAEHQHLESRGHHDCYGLVELSAISDALKMCDLPVLLRSKWAALDRDVRGLDGCTSSPR